jgi:hypothetical protein
LPDSRSLRVGVTLNQLLSLVPSIILVCTLLPLVKDNIGDLTLSDNNRAIIAGSQILKLVDIVILILEGEKLGCDHLQFGFQPKASTTMCSWANSAVIDHYNREVTVFYGSAMDHNCRLKRMPSVFE